MAFQDDLIAGSFIPFPTTYRGCVGHRAADRHDVAKGTPANAVATGDSVVESAAPVHSHPIASRDACWHHVEPTVGGASWIGIHHDVATRGGRVDGRADAAIGSHAAGRTGTANRNSHVEGKR